MRRLALGGLLYVPSILGAGILVGCGDNQPKAADGGMAGADGAAERAEAGEEVGDARTDGGGGDGGLCPAVSFTAPMDNTLLTVADDSSPAGGDACMNGFQYTVRVAVGAANGTGVELLGTMGSLTTIIATSTVMAGQVQFMNATLTQGTTTLKVRIGGVNGMICMNTAVVTVDCSLPIVTVIAPQPDSSPFSDVTKRLLAATATQVLKDQSTTTAGAQTDVVACSNRLGSATLFVRQMGETTRAQVGNAVTTVPALPANNCPTGLSFIVTFDDVTIPESTENADGTLNTATELIVDVTDAAAATVTGSSDPVDLWVDSTAPTISEMTPTPLCGSTQNAPGTFTTNVALNASTNNVTLAVTNTSTSSTAVPFGPPSYAAGVATFTAVAFPPGQNTVLARAIEPSGNATSLVQTGTTSCTVNVGTFPIVTFVTPTSGGKLCAVGNSAGGCLPDTNLGTPGWQNDVVVHVTAGGAPVTTGLITFTINGGAAQTATLDASGNATLSGQTVPEGTDIVITAATGNVPSFGVGMATIAVNVDTLPPASPVGLMAGVLERRQTSFVLSWTAPGDPGQPTVANYDIHVKVRDPMTGDPCGTEVGPVTFTGTLVPMGSTQSVPVDSLFIETDYCFTVAARDGIGNASAAANVMGRANFNTTLLSNPSAAIEDFGFFTDGTGNFGAPGSGGFADDTLTDLLAGTLVGQHAYIFFGKTTGYSATPDVTFTGPPSRRFGAGIVNAGDLDGDQLADIAIAAPGAVAADPAFVYIFSRKNAPWAVSGGWPSALSYTQASYVITADASYSGTFFGVAMARLGNFDGVPGDELAITAFGYSMGTGANAGRVLIVKGSATFGSITLPDAVNTAMIDGEAAGDRFGRAAEILPDNTLVVSASFASSQSGKLYAFRWPLGATQTASATTASDISVLTTANAQYGLTLSTLGPLGPTMASVVAAAPGAGGNFVDVQLAPVADGTFVGASGSTVVPSVRFTSSTTPTALGAANIGIPASGAAGKRSLIGNDTTADLVIAGQADPMNAVYIVSGANISSFTGTVNLASPSTTGVVTLLNKLPALWTAYGAGSVILDLDGDGYSDFVLGESGTTKPGRALVFW
jgi:hypothetical protein